MRMRAALLGTGDWARRVHLPALCAHPDVELVGIWGRNPDAAAGLAAGRTRAFGDLAALLSEVDFVSFALPPAVQAQLAPRVAAAVRAMMLEKPTALRAEDARRVERAVRASGVVAGVFLSRLWDLARRDWLDEAAAGQWESVSWQWRSRGMLPGTAGAAGWRHEAGALFDVGPHLISQLEYILGPIAEVDAAQARSASRLRLGFRHASGARSSADIDLAASVANTEESVQLTAPGRRSSWSTASAVDFVAAYHAELDALILQRSPSEAAAAELSGTASASHVVALLEQAAARVVGG